MLLGILGGVKDCGGILPNLMSLSHFLDLEARRFTKVQAPKGCSQATDNMI